MDYYKIIDAHEKFEKNSTVISSDEKVTKRSTYIEDDGVTLNNDEKQKTVERLVEGKLAEDVRKRVKASPDAPVLITEVEGKDSTGSVKSPQTTTTTPPSDAETLKRSSIFMRRTSTLKPSLTGWTKTLRLPLVMK